MLNKASLPDDIPIRQDITPQNVQQNMGPVREDVKNKINSLPDNFAPAKQTREKIINKLTGEEISEETYAILERLEKGETIDAKEIGRLKEVVEGKLKAKELRDKFISDNPQLSNVPVSEIGTHLIQTEERKNLRKQIIEKRLSEGSYTGVDENGNDVYNGSVEKGKRLDIVIGLPASGKSSAIVNPLSQSYKSAVIDSDVIKQMLPEYNDGWGASLVHKESSSINSDLLREAMRSDSNVVLPIVGAKTSSVEHYINAAKKYGYQVHVHLNELPSGKSVGRLLKRYFKDGRFINPEHAAQYENKPTEVYKQIKSRGDIDGYSWWNNDVEYGQGPIRKDVSGNDRMGDKYLSSSGRGSGGIFFKASRGRYATESPGKQIAPPPRKYNRAKMEYRST
jgi:predicted ABC-type ATPase